MEWQPAQGTQPLAPFDHQVAGQSSMLRYDMTTVCKPLIAREHFVYKTLPKELQEFTPEYRGEIEVQLQEEDGYIQLYGQAIGQEDRKNVCSCSSENPDSEAEDVKPKVKTKISNDVSPQNKCMIRVLRSGSYEVRPDNAEVFFTKDSTPHHPNTQSLNPWSLKNHKRLLDKMRKSEHSHDKIRFILLKNVVADFRHPCILDLKIGSRLHGDDASHVKVASQSSKCRQTTSSTLGVRLCGMQVYQVDSGAYHSVDKYHGRTLNDESFRNMLYDFLHNGSHLRTDLIQPIISRLSYLIQCLQGLSSFRFYASSLLIIYDGYIHDVSSDWDSKLHSPESFSTAESLSSEHETKESPDTSQSSIHHDDLVNKPDGSHGCDTKSDHISTSLQSLYVNPSETLSPCSQAYHLCSTDKVVNIHHSIPSLCNKNLMDDKTVEVPSDRLTDVLNVTNLSTTHSLQNVPTGVLSHADAVNLNQCILSSSTLHTDTTTTATLDNLHQCLDGRWDHSDDANTSWPKSHIFTSKPCCTGSLVDDTQTQHSVEVCSKKDIYTENHRQTLSQNMKHTAVSPYSNTEHQRQPANLQVELSTEGSLSPNMVKLDIESASPDRMDLSPPRLDLPGYENVKVDVRMIDFAHTTHQGFTLDKVRHTGPDTDYIQGLQNLVQLFQQIHERTQ